MKMLQAGSARGSATESLYQQVASRDLDLAKFA